MQNSPTLKFLDDERMDEENTVDEINYLRGV